MGLFDKPAWFVVGSDGSIIGAYPERWIADTCSYMADPLGFDRLRVKLGHIRIWQRYGRRK